MRLDRIVFMGSPDYAVPSLEALVSAFPGNVCGVVSQPDRPQGRHRHSLVSTAVKSRALSLGLPTFTPESKQDIHTCLTNLRPDVVIVIAYGRILSSETVSSFFCINAHGSLLPHYRGASPVQSNLLHHDQMTGVTLIKMDATMDTGPILSLQPYPISDQMHFPALFSALAHLSATSIVTFLQTRWLTDQVTLTAQDECQASYCHKISKADAELLPSETSLEWWGKIRAYSGNIGAWMRTDLGTIKILNASYPPLTPIEVQPEGKKPMRYTDYLRGRPEGLKMPL